MGGHTVWQAGKSQKLCAAVPLCRSDHELLGDDAFVERVAEVNLEIARDSELTLLFDPGHALDERIVAEQFVV